MKKHSAGLLVYRGRGKRLEVFVVHPGGPYYTRKDWGFWTIPKGTIDEGESNFDAAMREFKEETGMRSPRGRYISLGEIKRKDGKIIEAWAVEGKIDPQKLNSDTFEIEWPPKSGKMQKFPEIDRAEWMNLETAAQKLQIAQVVFLERLAKHLGINFKARVDSSKVPEQYRLL